MTSKRRLRAQIEKLEDTIAIIREMETGVPSKAFAPLGAFEEALDAFEIASQLIRYEDAVTLSKPIIAVRCTCPPNEGALTGACPIHDVSTTYTWTNSGTARLT